jgi:uncharacterized membrane protein YeiB
MILREGDILIPYAITSLYLFFARTSSNKTQIVLIIFPSSFLSSTLTKKHELKALQQAMGVLPPHFVSLFFS